MTTIPVKRSNWGQEMNSVGLRFEEKKDIVCPPVGSRIVKLKNTLLSVWQAEGLGGKKIGHYHTDTDRKLNRSHPVRNVLTVSLV